METETVVTDTIHAEAEPQIISEAEGTTTVVYTTVPASIATISGTVTDSPTPKKKKTRKYSEDLYLKFGFIPSPTNPELPLCLLCERVFSNESMKTPRLREHITKIHPDKADNDFQFFKELKEQFYISKSMDEHMKHDDKNSSVRAFRTSASGKGYINLAKQPTILQFSNLLNPVKVKELARLWIDEDVPSFDVQGFMVGSNFIKANVYCKEQGILAGVPFVDAICEELGIKKPNWLFQEGSYLLNASPTNRTIVCNVIGPAKKVLMAERVILNVLCRASGVATESHRIRSALAWNGWSGQVVGTRKTTPGFRMVEKYGLLVGGAGTHRYDMSSMVMLKDNHVKLSGPNQTMGELIAKTKKYAGFQFKIEVECASLDDAMNAAASGADIVMLDNFDSESAIQAAKELKSAFPGVLIEASGNISSSNATKYAVPEIDIISMSCLVQGYPIIDFSMKVD